MAGAHTISSLRRKYARLIGEVERLEAEAARHRRLASHVAETIKLFDAGLDVSGIRPVQSRTYSRWRGRGLGIRIYLAILRSADRPLTSLEIAERAAAFDPEGGSCRDAIKALVGPLNKALSKRVGRDVVRIEGRPRRWALAGRE